MTDKIHKRSELNKDQKPHLKIGTIGHVHHGKTWLMYAIEKYFGGRKRTLEEIKRRGIEL